MPKTSACDQYNFLTCASHSRHNCTLPGWSPSASEWKPWRTAYSSPAEREFTSLALNLFSFLYCCAPSLFWDEAHWAAYLHPHYQSHPELWLVLGRGRLQHPSSLSRGFATALALRLWHCRNLWDISYITSEASLCYDALWRQGILLPQGGTSSEYRIRSKGQRCSISFFRMRHAFYFYGFLRCDLNASLAYNDSSGEIIGNSVAYLSQTSLVAIHRFQRHWKLGCSGREKHQGSSDYSLSFTSFC